MTSHSRVSRELPPLPEPQLFIVPGDDGGRASGFVDAMAWEQDEFTKPMFTAEQMDERARTAVEAAISKEREAAAQTCEHIALYFTPDCAKGAQECAAAIRARK